MVQLSVLDLAPITRGGSVAATLRNTVLLAQHVERLGYNRLWPPNPSFDEQLPAQAHVLLNSVLSASAIGAPETVLDAMQSFAAKTGADELIATSMLYDHAARLRSFELLAELRGDLAA